MTYRVINAVVDILTERIMTEHHYTKTNIETAATAVNAGTCLEDTHVQGDDIIFTHIGEAVKQVFPNSLNQIYAYQGLSLSIL